MEDVNNLSIITEDVSDDTDIDDSVILNKIDEQIKIIKKNNIRSIIFTVILCCIIIALVCIAKSMLECFFIYY